MTVLLLPPTASELVEFIGGDDPENPQWAEAISVAVDLLEPVVTQAFRPLPQAVYSLCVLEVAAAASKRGNSVSGLQENAFLDGAPRWDPKDELNRVWPKLRRYVSPFPRPPVVVVEP